MANINVEAIIKKLSLTEKVSLLSGKDFWHTKDLPGHGVPSIRLSDGPNGVRGHKFFNGQPAACFPCGTGLGSTFNRALLEEAGRLMGEEAKAKGVKVILGPTVNIQRSPLGGRGFESIAEDPFLSGLAAAALVRGIQSTGVQACVKHFLCNDQEDQRMTVQCIVTERTIREIYALPFQLAVRDANPGTVMTSYNGINEVMCSENPKYLDKMLRKEWGWDGLIMSDWFGTYSTTNAIKAGLDLEMPGPSFFRAEALRQNAATGKPFPHVIDERVRAVLKLVKKVGGLDVAKPGSEHTNDTPETAALLRKIGNESLVLLKNEDNVLPLSKEKSTLVIGPNAKTAVYHGGGSASLQAYYAVTPFDGIARKLKSTLSHTVGAYSHKFLPMLGEQCKTPEGKHGMRWRVFSQPPGTPSRKPAIEEFFFTKTEMHLVDYHHPEIGETWYGELEGTYVADRDGKYDIGVVVAGTAKAYVDDVLVVDNATKQTKGTAFYGTGTVEEVGSFPLKKGQSYNIKIEFGSLPTSPLKSDVNTPGHGSLRVGGCIVLDDQEEINKSVRLAKEHDQVIICAGLNADWETEGTDRTSMKLPGVMDQLIDSVVSANPNTVVVMQTGTPEEMPWLDKTRGLVQAWYGGNETGNCIADVLFGDCNPSGKLCQSFPKKLQDVPSFLNFRTEAGRTLYGEDIYVGYRYYEFADKAVNFPFGYGLSYTNFSFSKLSVTSSDGIITATLQVTNTGSIAGAEVAQLYVRPKQAARINRPVKELKGFDKVHLQPGETKTVTIQEQEKYCAAYFDEERDQWCVEEGEYEVIVSDSSAVGDKALRGSFKVEETYWWSGI